MQRSVAAVRNVHRDFDAVCRLLEMAPERVLEPASEAARSRADALVSSLRVDVAGFELTRPVRVIVGVFEHVDAHTATLSFRWHSTRRPALFPVMEAKLEIVALAHGPKPLTQMTLLGRYRPPLSVAGRAADALLGHRVAEAAVAHLAQDVAARIERELSPAGLGRYLGARSAR